ncbi:hypothetical protein [Bradyrhizobium arachidis]|nr:hypothetical protein [Bradyrhizobium arachidis]UVO30428.1 hypothetical protein KUF59_06910 [Bradyrhizobium arachidis]
MREAVGRLYGNPECKLRKLRDSEETLSPALMITVSSSIWSKIPMLDCK